MPYKEFEVTKLYYTIGELAEMFDVAPSLIRFWETEFPILQPKKNKKGNRLYTPEDIESFRLIYHLVKERGYTLEGARNMIKENPQALRDKHDAVRSLERIRAFLDELRKQL